MKAFVLSLFPEIINGYCSESIMARAISEGHISVSAVNIRDYACNKHNRVDDYPYGGGHGMLMQAEPVFRAYEAVKPMLSDSHRVIYTSPCGSSFNAAKARELSCLEDMVIICGHYEGIDQRVLDEIVTDYISLGDYVLTGGELAALVILDSAARFVSGVLGNEGSADSDSFSDGLLEHPQYTRPAVWHGVEVPEVLLSGHHARVREWERTQSLLRTAALRPELLKNAELSARDIEILCENGFEKGEVWRIGKAEQEF